VFNPYDNTSRATGAPIYPRIRHTATRLSSGQVLVAGGWIGNAPLYWRRTSELYDPATGTWTATETLSTPRGNHTATLLDSGKVLVVGGDSTNVETGAGGETGTAELFDPATNTWSSAGWAGARAFHAATRLYSGQVLVTGGRYYAVGELMDARLYDPATNTWTPAPAMPSARTGHLAIRLYSGNVMLVGGGRNDVDMYDPYNNRWFAGPPLDNGYSAVSATLLYSGEVLVTLSNGQTALYDPSANTWQYAGSMSAALSAHAATLLDMGNVLVTGGASNGTAVSTAQRYTR
jgi:N-acetylneuraminic acid mutarotase